MWVVVEDGTGLVAAVAPLDPAAAGSVVFEDQLGSVGIGWFKLLWVFVVGVCCGRLALAGGGCCSLFLVFLDVWK